ncbi:MAG TPA: hypothetical protein DCF68_17325 [Cyanothece sp. UBA12306]|nr:hypothetical protein [Cyanothece sp. UBA12306]
MSDQFTQEIKYLEIRLQEYKCLREEILKHKETVNNYLNINYIVIAGIITFFSRQNSDFNNPENINSPALLFVTLLVVSLCWMIIFSWRREYEVVVQITNYLQQIEKDVNEFFSGNSLIKSYHKLPKYKILGWETFLKEGNKKKAWTPDIKPFIFWVIGSVTVILAFVFYSQCTSTVFELSDLNNNKLIIISFGLLLTHLLLSAFLCCIWEVDQIINHNKITYFVLLLTIAGLMMYLCYFFIKYYL